MKETNGLLIEPRNSAVKFETRPNQEFDLPELSPDNDFSSPLHLQVGKGATVGLLAGFTNSGFPKVDFAANTSGKPVPAKSILPLSDKERGREVVLLFEQDDWSKPVIMGLLQPPTTPAPPNDAKSVEVTLDGQQLVLSADKEIVLRCGNASITLTRAGKILIRGDYVLTRASGVNRIKGGSVQIN